jgi:hypothetical protein
MHEPSRNRSVWRRLAQTSVRGLMVLVLILGCILGWIARSASVQREAVALIQRTGASVSYDLDIHGLAKPGTATTKAARMRRPFWAPSWLVDRVGIDYFSHPVWVYLAGNAESLDAALPSVRRLGRLERLSVSSDGLTDMRLARIGGMESLWSLQLTGGKLGDDALKQIGGMRGLRYLNIDGSLVTDGGVAHLARLHDLEYLTLSCSEITDSGLSHLGGLTKLKYLTLCNTRITNAGLLHLQGLTNLSSLRLYGNLEVEGAGVDALQKKLPGTKVFHEF